MAETPNISKIWVVNWIQDGLPAVSLHYDAESGNAFMKAKKEEFPSLSVFLQCETINKSTISRKRVKKNAPKDNSSGEADPSMEVTTA